MAKKSAARAKVIDIKDRKVEKPVDEDYFEDAKKGLLIIIDAQIRNCDRIDNLFDTYEDLKHYKVTKCGMATIELAQLVCDHMVSIYKFCRDIVEKITYEGFIEKKWVNPFDNCVPTRDGVDEMLELYTRQVTFKCIKPIAEKLEQLRTLLIQEGLVKKVEDESVD